MRALESEGYRPTLPVPAFEFADAVRRESWIQLHSDLHPETRIDQFVQEPFDYDPEYEQALVGEILPGIKARFVSLDTLIRMKETAGREKDREDIRQLRLLQQDPSNE